MAVWSLCALDALATTVLYQDVPALARQADAIVRGTVVRQQSRWTGDHRRIVTDVSVRVEDVWKDTHPEDPREVVLIRQPGGVVGDIGQRVDGFPSFHEGEAVLLFLERRPDGSFVVSGAAQGKYRIERSADGKEELAIPDAHVADARVVDPSTHAPVQVTQKPRTLTELRMEVARALADVTDPPPSSMLPTIPGKARGSP
ncbi:MAG: hypothetical protein IRZ16_23970 [Myxococcaceae bacterium]|nr:hypothetical protein [Myxococcaceae bacterium]